MPLSVLQVQSANREDSDMKALFRTIVCVAILHGLTASLVAAEETKLTPQMLAGKQFRFSWKAGQATGQNGTATLQKDGTISGIGSPNESFWLIDGEGRLIFKHRDGRVSTIFTRAEQRDGKWALSGPFQFNKVVVHVLEEIPSGAAATTAPRRTEPEPDIADLVKGYSSQRVIYLNIGETYAFKLKNGAERVIKLVSVQEHRDSVIKLIRRADVRVEIDGKPLELACAAYVMPTETAGLRIQADTTSGWLPKNPKRVQFSIWDAADPIVDTKRFGFPIRNFRLFSHGTQAFNEPVHLGAGDDDPTGQKFYHNYGFDLAGCDGGEEIVSATDGEVNVCDNGYKWVGIADGQGHGWAYAHLASIEPGIAVGTRVARGQKIGMLGRTGGSGNFSHLHFGRTGTGTKMLNWYPWIVTAYQAEHPKSLFAVARPHQIALTGEKTVLDGSNSLAFGGRRIVAWRWEFHDGQTIKQAKAEKVYDKPGAYVATLWVKDDKGAEDVDFCQVKVFSKSNPESAMPHIFMTYTPSEDVQVGQPIRFKFWFQGKNKFDGPITVDFDDGTQTADYRSYKEFTHGFKTPGIHIVTAQCDFEGKPVTAKAKVIVQSAQGTGK
jgi:murein DD-endopeptidase MepM/ murein hydrolase activator NlpD